MTRPSRPFGALVLALSLLACAASAQEAPAPKQHEDVAPARRRPLDLPRLRAQAFDPARLRQRRAALLAGLPKGALVVIAAPKGESEIMSYRPDPHFLYLSGQAEPGLTMLLGPGLDVLFAPPVSKRWETWNGPRLSVGNELAQAAGFGEVADRATRKARIKAALAEHEGPLYLHGVDAKDLELEVDARSPGGVLGRLRQVKDAHEVALLQRACDVTSAALSEAISSIRPGQFEYEVEAVIEYLFARYGAERPGFNSIVGAGPNSCVLHYGANRRRFGAGELIVMDVGAEVSGYTADITRTVPTSGRFSQRQREIYELVLAAQEAGIRAIKPGATMGDVDRAARKVIRDAGYGKYFLHSTSHWLGLDVHDVGPRSRPLEPGMVLTVEPGIYLASEDLGVRIEDDVLVTETGARVLSDGVPKTVAEIEALMTGRGVGAQRVAPLPGRAAQEPAQKKPRYFDLKPR